MIPLGLENTLRYFRCLDTLAKREHSLVQVPVPSEPVKTQVISASRTLGTKDVFFDGLVLTRQGVFGLLILFLV